MCSCVKEVNTTGKSQKQLELQLGVCMLKSAQPFHREIKRDYNIDVRSDINNEQKMEELGSHFGMIMVTGCPEVLEKFMGPSFFDDSSGDQSEMQMINGRITKIEKQDFIVFSIAGDNRVLTKLYWISRVDSDIDLPNDFQSLLNKRVTVSYVSTEIFDQRTQQYKSVNVIASLQTD